MRPIEIVPRAKTATQAEWEGRLIADCQRELRRPAMEADEVLEEIKREEERHEEALRRFLEREARSERRQMGPIGFFLAVVALAGLAWLIVGAVFSL